MIEIVVALVAIGLVVALYGSVSSLIQEKDLKNQSKKYDFDEQEIY